MKDKHNINVEGQHYFVEQNGALVPVWDLRSSGENAGNANAIVFTEKVKSTPSPDGPDNVDWVELKKLSGGLANQVYRVDSVKGQPPSTVSSSLAFVLFLLMNIFFFAVHPRQLYKCQVYLELLYVFMIRSLLHGCY
jgi:hypothetical protein